mmetsp:Transcript_18538/g.21470  ORF Transcript_18538/g.21470 Transcript_18538/m.21470 type:complete len:431 (+) Transcript_18538:242-1534(+)
MTKMSSNRPSSHLRQFAPTKYKKAPQAPKRFKSSYMFYSTTKHKEIRAELTAKGEGKLSTTEVAKMVSRAWKVLPEDERETWEEMARQDKVRYEMEKSMYTGPWKVLAMRRAIKDPTAPKRPKSAFLSFSNSKRSCVKNKHKDAKNAEISRILAQMWKDANAEEKKIFVDEEFRLRQNYKITMSEWKIQNEKEFKSEREERENEAVKTIREVKLPLRPEDIPLRNSEIINSSATDSMSITSLGMKYSNKMVTETFAPSLSFPYTPNSLQQHSLSIGSNLPVPPYRFSNDEYIQRYNQQQQYSPSLSPSSPSRYSQDQLQLSVDAYSSNVANSYRNFHGVHSYQTTSSNNTNMNSYDRRYDTGGAGGGGGTGDDTYRQLHPYGYVSPSSYQQGTYPIDHQRQPEQNTSGSQQYYQYDPNQHFDQNHLQSQP